jgi:lipopolysaccharide export system protein LptA
MFRKPYHWLPVLLAVLAAGGARALPEDREKPIYIESRTAVREEKKGVTVYEGDVTIEQGSILIKGDKVTVYTANRQVERIVCVGDPAYYEQKPNAEDPPVVARARTIEYMLATDLVHLVEDASLEQQGTTLTGDRIDYDIKEEVVKARGDASGKERIRMVIPPSQQKEVQ